MAYNKKKRDHRLKKRRAIMKRAVLAGLIIGAIAVVMRPQKAH